MTHGSVFSLYLSIGFPISQCISITGFYNLLRQSSALLFASVAICCWFIIILCNTENWWCYVEHDFNVCHRSLYFIKSKLDFLWQFCIHHLCYQVEHFFKTLFIMITQTFLGWKMQKRYLRSLVFLQPVTCKL